MERSGDRFEVHSGTDAVSSGGTLYSSWYLTYAQVLS
jgi:hypothetical protein